MELSALIRRQIERDRRRGFPVEFSTEGEQIQQLMRDLVGLLGEVGEFANILKKVELGRTNPRYVAPSLADAQSDLEEELADTAIYLFRLSEILKVDLEEAILTKIKANDQRYKKLEG